MQVKRPAPRQHCTPKVLHDVVQHIVIHWFIYYNLNKREVHVSKRDLSHPQTLPNPQRMVTSRRTFPFDTHGAHRDLRRRCST